jgi:hypothetical protein
MKKTISLLLFFLLFSLTVPAQIQRTFMGFTLGKTTKAQVANSLKMKRMTLDYESDGGLSTEGVRFENETWPYVYFGFYEDKLYMVQFFQSEDFVSTAYLEKLNDALNTMFAKKYLDYMSLNNPDDKMTRFNDGKTAIYYSYGMGTESMMISLSFYDNNLWDQKLDSEEDED